MNRYTFAVEIEAENYESATAVFDTGRFDVPLGVNIVCGYLGKAGDD